MQPNQLLWTMPIKSFFNKYPLNIENPNLLALSKIENTISPHRPFSVARNSVMRRVGGVAVRDPDLHRPRTVIAAAWKSVERRGKKCSSTNLSVPAGRMRIQAIKKSSGSPFEQPSGAIAPRHAQCAQPSSKSQAPLIPIGISRGNGSTCIKFQTAT